jgi:hypothetical protein
MSGEIAVYVVVVIVVVALALGVWLLDARRNDEVENDEERAEPDPSTDPTDPLHRRH